MAEELLPTWVEADKIEDFERPLDHTHLWPEDAGTLSEDGRSCLLALIKGPYVAESSAPNLWNALLSDTEAIKSRLADLFLELCIDSETGIAFAKNVTVEDRSFPKATTTHSLSLLDSIMVIHLRKELQSGPASCVIVGQVEVFQALMPYRNLAKMDQAAYLKKLKASWNRLVEQRLLIRTAVEGRYEISPVMKLVFGADEAAALAAEYNRMLTAESETVEMWEYTAESDEAEDGVDDGFDGTRTVEASDVSVATTKTVRTSPKSNHLSVQQEDLFSGLL